MTRYQFPIKVGLTGGIGSGKSAVSDELSNYPHIVIIDTDVISRNITSSEGLAIPALLSLVTAGQLPSEWINQTTQQLNRALVRQDCFSHPALRLKLESVLHPLIRECAVLAAEKAQTQASIKMIVFVVPLLIESGWWKKQVDQIWVVDAPIEVQIQRIIARSAHLATPITRAEAQRIIKTQVSRDERLKHAHHIINNQSNLSALHQQVARLMEAFHIAQ